MDDKQRPPSVAVATPVRAMHAHLTPSVSTAMATFNGERFLEAQLRSIAIQTMPPDELVVSDDASTDNTCDIVRAFAATAPFPVRLIANSHRVGYALNFERAIEQCRGSHVFLADQDDIWNENKIERVMACFSASPEALLIIHDRLVVDADLAGSGASALQGVRQHQEPDTVYVAGCATAIRHELISVTLPLPRLPDVGHDTWLHAVADLLGSRIVLGTPLMRYRRHEQTVSMSRVSPHSTSRRRRARRPSVTKLGNARSGHRYERLQINQRLQEELATRLNKCEATTLFGERATVGATLAQSRADALGLRLHAMSKPTFPRLVELLRLFIAGKYPSAHGVAVLAHDLITIAPRSRSH